MLPASTIRVWSFVVLFTCGWAQIAKSEAVAQPAQTSPATAIDAFTAKLGGVVTISGATAESPHLVESWVEYGATASYGSKTVGQGVFVTDSNGIAVEILATSLQPSSPYHFRFVVKDGTSTYTGSDLTFNTTAASPIVLDPLASNYLLLPETFPPTTVTVSGTGSSPTFTWLRDGKTFNAPICSSTAFPGTADFILGPLPLKNTVGVYTCTVSNPISSATTEPMTLAIASTKPSAAAGDPITTLAVGGSFSITALVTPADPAASYAWSKVGNPDLTGLGTVTGKTSAKLSITNATSSAGGDYVCSVTSHGKSVNVNQVHVIVTAKATLKQVPNQEVQVGQTVSISLKPYLDLSALGKVTVSGLPLGVNFDGSSNIFGKPIAASPLNKPSVVKVVSTNLAGPSAPMTFTINVHPLESMVATSFTGLIDRSATELENGNNGGALSLVVAATGTFTGKVNLGSLPTGALLTPGGTQSLGFSGSLGINYGYDPYAEVTISRKLLTPLKLKFSINRSTGALTGTLAIGSGPKVPVTAYGLPYSVKTPTLTLNGLHNFWMESPLAGGGVVVTVGPPPTGPEGSSIGVATISTTGLVGLVVTLADGSVVTTSVHLGQSGAFPLHGFLYGNRGAVHGWLQITDSTNPSFNSIGGTVTWNKTAPAGATDYSYASFDFGVGNARTMAAAGSEQRVQQGKILWGIPDTQFFTNTFVAFSGGGIGAYGPMNTGSPADMLFKLSKTYAVTMKSVASFPPGTMPTPPTVSLYGITVDGAKATFNGEFTLDDNGVKRKVQYKGVVAPGIEKGKGFFLLKQLPASTSSPVLSGAVRFERIVL